MQIIGVEVAKQKLDVSIDDKTVLTVDNHEESFKAFLKTLPHNDQVGVVMEASGGYEGKLAAFLQAREIAVAVVNPKRVRDYAKSNGVLCQK